MLIVLLFFVLIAYLLMLRWCSKNPEDHRLTAASQFILALLWAIIALDNWQSHTITNSRLFLIPALLIAVISLIRGFSEVGKAMKH